MKKHGKLLILALVCALLLSVGAVYGASRTKTMEVTYNDINLVVDGVPVTPKDANGNVVEPFIYEGTTYLPVRAVGEALGKQVGWDGKTKTVYIGDVPGKDIYLLDVCPPYEKGYSNIPEYSTMMGEKYPHSFEMSSTESYAYFNLNGEYSALEFDFGHVDGTYMRNGSYSIYLDGEYLMTLEGTADMTVQHITVPLDYALQMKIVGTSGYLASYPYYAFANAVLTK